MEFVRGRFQSAFQFSDKDVEARVQAKNPEDASAAGYDFTLRPILFVVPRGSPPAATEARVKEAEALRSRFQSCEQGIPMARGPWYRSTATRSPSRSPFSNAARKSA